MNRQVLPDLPHPPPDLQHALAIPSLAENAVLRSYIADERGSTDSLPRQNLADFFRHGFDGSGAGNYFDAGAIDLISVHLITPEG